MKKNVYLPIKFGGVLHQKGGWHWSDLSLSESSERRMAV